MSTVITDEDMILVTGASGFIASHIVKQLVDKGYRVRGTVRSLKNDKKVAPLRQLGDKDKARFEIELVEADLLDAKSWPAAVSGCTYVIHTASPFPASIPRDENEIIKPAVDGTLNVLEACCEDSSKVKRVVLTSSIAAIVGVDYQEGKMFSEADWPDEPSLTSYLKSKTLAEKAAWNFVKNREAEGKSCFDLAVINPGYVMGPLIHDSECTSMEIIKRLMTKAVPLVPDVYLAACDVRDVATAHVNALTCPEAKNNRHIITSAKEATSMVEWAGILSNEFGAKNYPVPTRRAPNFLLKVVSYFDTSVQQVLPMLGVRYSLDNSRMINVLGIKPFDLKTTIIDMAYSMIEKGFIPKKF